MATSFSLFLNKNTSDTAKLAKLLNKLCGVTDASSYDYKNIFSEINLLLENDIVINDTKLFVNLLNICNDENASAFYFHRTIDKSMGKIDLEEIDMDFLLHKLVCIDAKKKISGLLAKLKLTETMFKTLHDNVIASFKKGVIVKTSSAKLIYKIFADNYIIPTREMFLEILEYIDMPYEQVQDIITKKEFVTCVFNMYDNLQQTLTFELLSKELYSLLQDDEDYRKYVVYVLIYTGFKKSEMTKHKKNDGIKFDDALLKYYVFRATTIDKKVLKFFADEGAKPDADTIIGIMLRSTGKHNKILLNNICTLRPDFEYHRFGFKKITNKNNNTLEKIKTPYLCHYQEYREDGE